MRLIDGARIALLALCAVLIATPGVGLADDDNQKKTSKDSKSETKKEVYRPDLKIEFIGLYSPENTQLVKFKVTNIGRERSPATTALGETLRPEPRNVQGMEVPALNPGQSKEILYPLAAPCDGHEVKATVTIADDNQLENNTDQATACDEKPRIPPGSASTSTGGIVGAPKSDVVLAPPADGLVRSAPVDTESVLLPAHLQPGPHVGFRVDVERFLSIGVVKESGICPSHPPSIPQPTVGFTRNDASGLCQFNTVYQTAVSLDLDALRKAHERSAIVNRAVLSWKDEMHESGFEEPITFANTSCVYNLGAPTVDWEGRASDELIPNDFVDGGVRSNQWEITGLLQTWLAQPIAASRGVLLRGMDESFESGDNDEADCYSRLSDIKLTVDYTVLK